MVAKTVIRLSTFVACLGLGVVAACSSSSNSNNYPITGDAGGTGPGVGASSHASSGGSSATGASDGGTTASDSSGSALDAGLLIDNMSADAGTQIALVVPPGDTPGSFYAYADPNSLTIATMQLMDTKLTTPVTNADGTTITGDLCFNGTVSAYAGIGMSFAYAKAADAAPGALSLPTPFDASKYSGVSFYMLVSPSDGGVLPTFHFGIPDTQTADPAAWPQSACTMGDAGPCDDDFGADLSPTPGRWTKMAFKFVDLTQGGWGASFTALKTNQLIGMKWQANGGGQDAAVESFNFCISNIYFTP